MYKYIANFWVCGEPDKVTAILGVKPTSVRLKKPYDYWDYKMESNTPEDDVITSMIEFLESISTKLSQLDRSMVLGVTFIQEVADNGLDTFHTLEPEEMKKFSDLKVPVAFQTICGASC